MPSPNPRIQVAASPDLYAQIKTLAKGRNVTLSNMVQELCLHALKTDVIRAEYQHACDTYGEVPVQEDKRVRPEARPWVKSYEDVAGKGTTSPAVTTQEMDAMVQAKRKGKLTQEQAAAAADVALTLPASEQEQEEKDKRKKELLLSVLRELMEE